VNCVLNRAFSRRSFRWGATGRPPIRYDSSIAHHQNIVSHDTLILTQFTQHSIVTSRQNFERTQRAVVSVSIGKEAMCALLENAAK
jgi:hypothetical protein